MAIASYGQEQEFRNGLKFGVGETVVVSDSDMFFPSSKLNMMIGFSSSFDLLKGMAIQGDIHFSRKGFNVDGKDRAGGLLGSDQEFTNYYTLNYIELPLFFKPKFASDKFSVFGLIGASFNFNLGAKYDKRYWDDTYDEYDLSKQDVSNGLNSFHTAVQLGYGMDFKLSGNGLFFFDIRHQLSSKDLGFIQDTNGNNQTIGLRGITFNFGSRYVL